MAYVGIYISICVPISLEMCARTVKESNEAADNTFEYRERPCLVQYWKDREPSCVCGQFKWDTAVTKPFQKWMHSYFDDIALI